MIHIMTNNKDINIKTRSGEIEKKRTTHQKNLYIAKYSSNPDYKVVSSLKCESTEFTMNKFYNTD